MDPKYESGKITCRYRVVSPDTVFLPDISVVELLYVQMACRGKEPDKPFRHVIIMNTDNIDYFGTIVAVLGSNLLKAPSAVVKRNAERGNLHRNSISTRVV